MRLATLSSSIRIRSLAVALVGVLWLALAAGTASKASAAPVFDSITGNTPTGSVTATVLGWQAAQFSLPAASYSSEKYALGSVVLNLANTALGTDYAIEIYDSTSGASAKPKSKVAALVGPATIVIGNNSFTPGLLFPELDPGKSYWVVAKGFFTFPQWSTAGNSGVISPVSQQSMKTASTTDAGSNWTTAAASSNPYMMTVNAVAVPEPSTWAMGLAGLGFAGVTALRHRRRQG
ncbi:MAG: PEP-CTERM sorting domain-containing protein [Planctomycetota bacterium]|nr:PEP-CTERM sorting domain-containing protein [Planctomycetota bacterium]